MADTDIKKISRGEEITGQYFVLLDRHIDDLQIAITLTYDPSNFSKFFKKYVKLTPDQWRKNNRSV
ncbi:AraC family transcriptional regulator [Chitinophaga sp. 22321]|uniref:Helix-turn-helix transcriptional regulator n=1 Tax=Chitinophaga hostae TaxID=2831022 RepID=A0ABS5J732_9BACT|nr:helix-turn-helix transcriptional regulator [Chitinophaga hostae]MBS0031023.1 helix-turn-helix transcriptional regulator [Chitinophaga hostae]